MSRVNFPKRFTNSPAAPPHDPTLTYKVWAEDVLPVLAAIQDAGAGINTEQVEVDGVMTITRTRQFPLNPFQFGDESNADQVIEFLTGGSPNPAIRWNAAKNKFEARKRNSTAFSPLGGGGGQIRYVGPEEEFQDIQSAIDSLNGQPGKVYVTSGTYEISEPIKIKGSGIELIGASGWHGTSLPGGGGTSQAVYIRATAQMSSMIKATRTNGDDLQAGDRVYKIKIIGFKLDGNDKVSGAIIDLTRVSFAEVRDCWIIGGTSNYLYPNLPNCTAILMSAAGTGFLIREDAHYNEVHSCYIGLCRRGVVIEKGSNSNRVENCRIQSSEVGVRITEANNNVVSGCICEFFPVGYTGNYDTIGVELRTFAVGNFVAGCRFEYPNLAGAVYTGNGVNLGQGDSNDVENPGSFNPNLFPSSDNHIIGNYYTIGGQGPNVNPNLYIYEEPTESGKVGSLRNNIIEGHLLGAKLGEHLAIGSASKYGDNRFIFSIQEVSMQTIATYGIFGSITILNTSTIGAKTGVSVAAEFGLNVHASTDQSPTGTIYGVRGIVSPAATAAITYPDVIGAEFLVNPSGGGSVGPGKNVRVLWARFISGMSGSIPVLHGIDVQIANTGSGSIGTLYGIHVGDLSSVPFVTTRYALAVDGGQSYHREAMLIGAIDAPHQSAILELRSSAKGLLVPRTTRGSISSPTNGLIVYDTADNKFYGYANGAWVALH